jgi:hypothetical protein
MKCSGKAGTILLALLVVGAGFLVLIQRQQIKALEMENLALRAAGQQLQTLRAENERLSQGQADLDELARLRKEHSELMRLRGEVTSLRRKAGQVQTAPKPASAPAAPVPETPRVNTFTANVQASVGHGQTLVSGGWSTAPGQRTLILLTPEIGEEEGAAKTVKFNSMVVEMPEAVLDTLGLQALKVGDQESSSQQVLTAERMEAVLKMLNDSENVQVLATPAVSTLDGRQAQVQAVELKNLEGSAEPVAIGPILDIIPTLAEDQQSVELQLQTRLIKVP